MNATRIKKTSPLELSEEDFEKIRLLGSRQSFAKDQVIFAEGDKADYIYFIELGEVSIQIQKFTRQEEVSRLGAGDQFGEMAFFSGDRRSASVIALNDVNLLMVDREAFLNLLKEDRIMAEKVDALIDVRNQDLASKENLFSALDKDGDHHLRIGIKGDPSLRESAFSRERYESVVDGILPLLQANLADLLLNRNACEIMIHFNSGEILIKSIFDPFTHEVHPATKLINRAYIERHFPVVDYEDKEAMIKDLYGVISRDARMKAMPDEFSKPLQFAHDNWASLRPHEIVCTISKLVLLRNIPDFYLRNFTMSMIRDAIRIQFNCDGTHILDAEGYQEFLKQNLLDEDMIYTQANERRQEKRRKSLQNASSLESFFERRSPPGRRQEDWEELIRTLD
ncbi:MAG: cyclic nucleotide-binding domain-containing protein [Gammaproteobacteria bacterium]|nr:cyclic nucleotide-binding domain-containing protein [Gammaproteobacteria bacterium]